MHTRQPDRKKWLGILVLIFAPLRLSYVMPLIRLYARGATLVR